MYYLILKQTNASLKFVQNLHFSYIFQLLIINYLHQIKVVQSCYQTYKILLSPSFYDSQNRGKFYFCIP